LSGAVSLSKDEIVFHGFTATCQSPGVQRLVADDGGAAVSPRTLLAPVWRFVLIAREIRALRALPAVHRPTSHCRRLDFAAR